MKHILLALGLGVLSSTPSLFSADLPKGITQNSFQNPPKEFRLIQYQLTPGALKDYPNWGIGGHMAFFYKNLYKQGPKAPKSIGRLVDAAFKNGAPVWLADDWGYPSGMAGGRVVEENSDFEVRSLVMLSHKGKNPTPIKWKLPDNLHDIVAAMVYPIVDGSIDLSSGTQLQPNPKSITGKGIKGPWEMRVFARYTRTKDVQAQSTMKQFGHTGRYPDLMNHKAMSRFIAHMHEPILKQIKDPRRKVEGFYCNEPNLMQTHWVGGKSPYACAPWNEDLPPLFKKMHGYELFDVLPYLFEGKDIQARRARLHYRQSVAELLTDSFARQIRDWCAKKGIKSSGHFLLNDYLAQHVQGYGDMMKFVSEFDVPALDIPIPNPNQFMKFRYQQSRFFSSVTAWKERDATLMLLDPIIGGYGMKRLSPELPLLTNAVNMASFHGVNIFSSYLPRTPGKGAKGYTKDEYNFLNEYIGRITQVLRGAKREAGVALFYPITMFQSDLIASDQRWMNINQQHNQRQKAWDQTENALLNGDIEYMIVHPEGVEASKVKDGWMSIGQGSYHTLIMPQMDMLSLSVAKKLSSFQKSGGKVLWADQVPSHSEYEKNNQAFKKLLDGAIATPTKSIATSIQHSYSSDFNLSFSVDSKTMAVGRFHNKGKQVYFLANRQQKEITTEVKGSGKVSVLDPSTGKIARVSLPAKLSILPVRALMVIP